MNERLLHLRDMTVTCADVLLCHSFTYLNSDCQVTTDTTVGYIVKEDMVDIVIKQSTSQMHRNASISVLLYYIHTLNSNISQT